MSYVEDGNVDATDVALAEHLSRALHAGQLDRVGAPYADHPARVASTFADPSHQVVALLHDAVEASALTVGVVEALFGIDVALAVDAISRRSEESLSSYLARVKLNPIAVAVKRADVADNADPARLSLLRPRTRARLELKYAQLAAMLSAARE